jgi:hypothetical protein
MQIRIRDLVNLGYGMEKIGSRMEKIGSRMEIIGSMIWDKHPRSAKLLIPNIAYWWSSQLWIWNTTSGHCNFSLVSSNGTNYRLLKLLSW